LDLTLWIDQSLVLIAEDTMTAVFDYDPMVADIERLATECHYETQERLITRIVIHCAAYVAVESIEIVLRKSPMQNGSGSLGVRTCVDAQKLQQLRDANCARG
jgi:dihydroneopterin aldolase